MPTVIEHFHKVGMFSLDKQIPNLGNYFYPSRYFNPVQILKSYGYSLSRGR
jgi:hypothetical protein